MRIEKIEILRKIGSMIKLLKLHKLINLKKDNRDKPPYKLMYFCGLKGIDYLNSSLLSVYKNWLYIPDLIIVTDGTPTSYFENKVIKWPQEFEIHTWEICARFFLEKGNSSLFNYAKHDLWGKKLVSILFFSEKWPTLYSDTDVIWFLDPLDSLNIERISPYMKMSQDIDYCYSYSMLKDLEETSIMNEPPRNAGVIYATGDFSKHPKWDRLCKYLEINADDRTEQTTLAILNRHFGEIWKKSDIYLEIKDINSIFSYRYYNKFIARHYVNTKPWLFWRDFLLFFFLKLNFGDGK